MTEATSNLQYPNDVNGALSDLIERVESEGFSHAEWYQKDVKIDPADADFNDMTQGDYSLGLFISKGDERQGFDELCNERLQGQSGDAKSCWVWLDDVNVVDGTLNALFATKNFSADDVDGNEFTSAGDFTLHMFDADSGFVDVIKKAFGATTIRFSEDKTA